MNEQRSKSEREKWGAVKEKRWLWTGEQLRTRKNGRMWISVSIFPLTKNNNKRFRHRFWVSYYVSYIRYELDTELVSVPYDTLSDNIMYLIGYFPIEKLEMLLWVTMSSFNGKYFQVGYLLGAISLLFRGCFSNRFV